MTSSLLVMLYVATPLLFAFDPADATNPANIVQVVLSEAERMVFVTNLSQAVEDGQHRQVDDLIDWSELIDIATAREDSPEMNRLRNRFKIGFLNQVAKSPSGTFTNVVIENTKNGGSFTFLRFATFENEPVALFRMKSANQSVNYHRYFLKRSPDGRVRANDIHLLTSAERMSDTLRRIWLPLRESSTKSLWDRLIKPADPILAALNPLQEMLRLNRQGHPERSLEIYRMLPEKVQAQKILLLARLPAAQQVSMEEYEAVINDFRKFYPNDASLDFFLIDGYALKKEFDKCLNCIERTADSLGGDPWLVSLRASVLVQAGRIDEATAASNAAIELEPDFKDIRFSALSIAIRAKNNKDIARHLTSLENTFGIEIGDLTEIPDYADFVESPEYQKWMESRK